MAVATFAHAALLAREAASRTDVAELTNWAMQKNAQRFFFQSLMDLRIEPCWFPDYLEPAQLKQELLGRLLIVAEDNRKGIPN